MKRGATWSEKKILGMNWAVVIRAFVLMFDSFHPLNSNEADHTASSFSDSVTGLNILVQVTLFPLQTDSERVTVCGFIFNYSWVCNVG